MQNVNIDCVCMYTLEYLQVPGSSGPVSPKHSAILGYAIKDQF